MYQIDIINKTAEYGRIIVDGCFSGKGYGYKMTIAALEIARKQLLLNSIYLTVYENNIRAVSIYESAGFVKIKGLLDSTGKSMIKMQLKL